MKQSKIDRIRDLIESNTFWGDRENGQGIRFLHSHPEKFDQFLQDLYQITEERSEL